MQAFQLDDNIPIPGVGKSVPVYPFASMEIGQSFFAARSSLAMGNAARAYGGRHGKKFSARAVIENGAAGSRVWRTA